MFGKQPYREAANELTKAWNTGHTENIATIHADSRAPMLAKTVQMGYS
ncbi:MAG: hypothetical protein LBL56_05960 [Treponema sp.]|nr:hypothetical protein [Treponema sp.]